MPSCSTSSNIQSSFNAISVTQGGSRLLADIPMVSGITLGNVVRYDVLTSGYTAAKADSAPSSEVFGVVEAVNTSSNTLSVVIYGSINLAAASLVSVDGTTGGSGGNDIYFLSGNTAGILQNLAPTNLNHIIKPVYQAAPHGSYSGVVMNYLGYKIGGEVESVLEDSELGNIQIVVGNNDFTRGYVDASISHQLAIADYSEFYAKFGTQYGYIEKIVVTESIGGSVQVGQIATQPNSTYTGTITAIEPGNKVLYLYRAPGTSLASVNKNLVVATSATTSVIFQNPLVSAEVYAVHSPIITLSEPLVIRGNSGTEVVTQQVNVGVKVKPQGISVSVPRSVAVTSLTADTFALGITWSDVSSTLTSFDSRLDLIESRLGI
jgi:hypothetical protein